MNLRLLLDENSESVDLVDMLRNAGHDVACLKDLAPKGASNQVVLEIAKRQKRVLYTRDKAFLPPHAQQEHAGIIFEFKANMPKDMTNQQILEALNAMGTGVAGWKNSVHNVNAFKRENKRKK